LFSGCNETEETLLVPTNSALKERAAKDTKASPHVFIGLAYQRRQGYCVQIHYRVGYIVA
jgi:hypothetical protein